MIVLLQTLTNRKEAPVRTVPHQPTLRPVFIAHEHAREYAEIDRLLDECGEAMGVVEADLLVGVERCSPLSGLRSPNSDHGSSIIALRCSRDPKSEN